MITLLERISSPLLSKQRFLPITWFGQWFTYLTDNKKTDKLIPPESKVKKSLHNYEQDQVLRNYTLLWNKTIPCLFVDPIYVMIEDVIARDLTR